ALRVDTDDPETQKRVSYTVRVDEAARKVQSGEASVAAFVRPTGIAETERVARSGATMPQKSTYFYPKMPSGLVARRID
ncbi:MAG: DUF1015 domain-containing protein, partial [Candidatus Poribacteria bacterium]|nr:DUF1015 domain-containing protein [Candidatus Poribacteria bacterium]